MYRYGTSSSSEELYSKGCDSNDEICHQIFYQSNCGALKRWSEENDKYWSIIYRHEIYWKTNCEISMIEIQQAEIILRHTIYLMLLLNVIVNFTCNFVLGFLFPICLCSYFIWHCVFLFGKKNSEREYLLSHDFRLMNPLSSPLSHFDIFYLFHLFLFIVFSSLLSSHYPGNLQVSDFCPCFFFF